MKKLSKNVKKLIEFVRAHSEVNQYFVSKALSLDYSRVHAARKKAELHGFIRSELKMIAGKPNRVLYSVPDTEGLNLEVVRIYSAQELEKTAAREKRQFFKNQISASIELKAEDLKIKGFVNKKAKHAW